MSDPRTEAEQVEVKITQRFIAALRLWTQQNQENRLGDYGTLKVDCVDLIEATRQAARREVWDLALAMGYSIVNQKDPELGSALFEAFTRRIHHEARG